MKTTKIIERSVEVIDKIFCNRCGEEFGLGMNFEGLSYNATGGYDSKIGDMVEWQLDMCEPCLLWLFKQCKIDPIVCQHDIIPGIG